MVSTRFVSVLLRSVSSLALTLLLISCGGGSGASNNANLGASSNQSGSSDGPSFKAYTGANPTGPNAADIQNFQVYFWSRLAGDDRCGACHVPGGAASTFPFAREDDINLAYDTIINFIDKQIPAKSVPVTTIGGGHQGSAGCWVGSGLEESERASCASDIAGYITSWVNASAPTSFLAALNQFAPTGDVITTGKNFTPTAPAEFSGLHTLLKDNCSGCHTPNAPAQQRPFFAVDDVSVAYEAVQNKVDLAEPTNSRLYLRLAAESHNCWTASCSNDAGQILTAINNMIVAFPTVELADDLQAVASRGLKIPQGFILSVGNRVEDAAVGLWRFDDPVTQNYAKNKGVDVNGSAVDIDLVMSGDVEWLDGGGVKINDGKLQAESTDAINIFDNIAGKNGTREYSIEAWVVPLNVTQGENNPATIVSYSRTTQTRNFMLSQQLYNYNFYNRNTLDGMPTDLNGEPILSTPDAREALQATLQHVVATYSAVDGRRIYVNGELIVEEADPSLAGSFNEWQGNYALVVGNEVSSNRQWQGSIRLLAIHNKALSADDVKTNYDIGVGDKYYLMFPISHLTNMNGTYIVFQVEVFDEYSYLFSNPIFYSADETIDINMPMSGMRIGINSREAQSGQAYINVNDIIDSSDLVKYISEDGNGGMQVLSTIGTLVPKELGKDNDQFFLTFDTIAGINYSRPTVTFSPPVKQSDDSTEQSDIGLKTFAEINASLSALTGISPTNTNLRSSDGEFIYEVVKQQMPGTEDIQSFVSAHQMGIAQLAFKYCDVLVEQDSAGPTYFSGFNYGASPAVAFNGAGKTAVISPLLERLLADDSPTATDDQPVAAGVQGTRQVLENLIDELVANNTSTTKNIVKATCAAAYGSALMLIQ